jgi:riboflavin synthase
VFTGLVATTGTLRTLGDYLLHISCGNAAPEKILQDLAIGDSVAVDGICLTVTEILPTGFVAAVSPETLSRTTLASETGEALVNLEPSLRVGSKLGGHFVTGHIDGIGYLDTAVQTATAWEMSFRVSDPRVARYIVPKGSIAVNGVSLTVADCNPAGTWFKVAVIPHTYAETNLRKLQPGSPVNLEGDVLGKYVEKFLRIGPHPQSPALADLEATMAAGHMDDSSHSSSESLTPAFLAEHGYL